MGSLHVHMYVMSTEVRRRRRTAATATATGTGSGSESLEPTAEPTDEADQKKIVQSLRQHTIEITNELCNNVAMCCLGAALLSTLSPWIISYVDGNGVDNVTMWFSNVSLVVHTICFRLAQQSKISTTWTPSAPVRTMSNFRSLSLAAIAIILLQVAFLLYIYRSAEVKVPVDPVRIGQVVGNVCTSMASIFVAMDSTSTEDALRKHDGSRYRFKQI